MKQLQCTVCGGTLVMQEGGKKASCQNCGIEYPVEQLREMLAVSRNEEAHTLPQNHLEKGPEVHLEEQEEYICTLRSILREQGVSVAAAERMNREELEYAIWKGTKSPKAFSVEWGEYGLKAGTGGILTEKQLDFLRKILSQYKKKQKGSKVWNRTMCSIRYGGKWVALVSPEEVLYEVSGFSSDAMQDVLTELDESLPLKLHFTAKGEEDPKDIVGNLPERTDAVWTELKEASETKNAGVPFEMMVEDVFPVEGQGVMASGFVKFGTVQAGQRIAIIKKKTGERREAVVGTIDRYNPDDEQFHPVNCAAQEDGIQLFIPNLSKKDVSAGDKLVNP